MTEKKRKSRLRRLVVEDICMQTESALGAARYHLSGVKHYLRKDGVQKRWKEAPGIDDTTRVELQADVNRFHWEVRAFFWELVAAFDCLLQELNRAYDLGLADQDVNWETFTSELSRQKKGDKLARRLQREYDRAWFAEVRDLRNLAHRGFPVFVFAHSEDRLEAISLASTHPGTIIYPTQGHDTHFDTYLEQVYALVSLVHGEISRTPPAGAPAGSP